MAKQKYVSYRRVSSKRQAESGLGIDFQTTVIRHYVEKADGILVKDFVEFGSARSYHDRKELMAAIDYCVQNDCFLCVSRTDRLSRNVENTIDIWRMLEGKLFICDLPVREDGKLNKSALYLHADHAERELEIISLRNLAMHEQKRQRGQKHETKHKLSLEHRKAGNQTAIDNKNKFYEDIRLIRFVEGAIRDDKGLDQITEELNFHGYRTRTGRKYNYETTRKLVRILARNKAIKEQSKRPGFDITKLYIPESYKPRRHGYDGIKTLKLND